MNTAQNAPAAQPEPAAPGRFPAFSRAACLLRVIWLATGALLLMLALTDAGLRAVLKPEKLLRVDASVRVVPREAMAANHAGGSSYWQEHERARETRWRPYVYFRRKPFAGRSIHVDAHGFRVTPPLRTEAATLKGQTLWLFGGSTVWGTGVSDAQTLAAELANQAAADNQLLRVENFGETGYVSAQSQLAFMAALRCGGNAAQTAVFVDGVNDVFAAFQSGIAGIPQNESNRRAEFNATRSVGAFAQAVLARLDGIQLLRQRLHAPASSAPANDAKLADEIARAYLAVVAQTRAIAAAHHIQTRFIWQPSLFEKQSPSSDERTQIAGSFMRHRDLQRASTRALKTLLAASPQPDVLVLDALFGADATPIYLDFAHTGQRGNAILAQRIWRALRSSKTSVGALPSGSPDAATASCADRPVPHS